jgi:lysophospholipase L1-like esterase
MVFAGVCLRRYAWPLFAGGVLLAAAASVGLGFSPAASARHASSARAVDVPAWVASWTASPEAAEPGSAFAGGFHDQTVRDLIYTSAGGTTARVRLANTFGSRPLEIGRAAIGVARPDGAVAVGTSIPLSFAGSRSVMIQPGSEVISDPVRLAVRPLELLAVSVFAPGATGPPTQHTYAHEISYVADGDQVLTSRAAAFTARTSSWYFVTDVVVTGSARERGTVVALGDSITDGDGSRTDANARWPNDLARRLDALPGGTLSVIDAGIGGNRVLNDTACCGVSALARFGRDVVHQAGVTEVIVLEGINDIDHGANVSALRIIAGYRELIARAHAAGLKIFGATLTPFKGAYYWTPARERMRETINAWIRDSGAFDGVIDFAGALADSRDPEMLRPAYDSGDHLHPNDAGYQAMADAVGLATLLHAAGT